MIAETAEIEVRLDEERTVRLEALGAGEYAVVAVQALDDEVVDYWPGYVDRCLRHEEVRGVLCLIDRGIGV